MLPDHTLPLADWHQLIATHEEQGIHIDRRTAASSLDWAPYDHAMAVDSLLIRVHNAPARAVAATVPTQ